MAFYTSHANDLVKYRGYDLHDKATGCRSSEDGASCETSSAIRTRSEQIFLRSICRERRQKSERKIHHGYYELGDQLRH
ncbi:hypothetical protein D3C85_1745460 [compost metagenome]